MKICKVEIIKRLKAARCDNIYPSGYNASNIEVLSYSEYPLVQGDNIGYCLGIVEDDFTFTDKMVETSKEDAEAFIDERASMEQTEEAIAKYKEKKQYLQRGLKLLEKEQKERWYFLGQGPRLHCQEVQF